MEIRHEGFLRVQSVRTSRGLRENAWGGEILTTVQSSGSSWLSRQVQASAVCVPAGLETASGRGEGPGGLVLVDH